MTDTPTPISATDIGERKLGHDHDRAIIAAMQRIGADEHPVTVAEDYFTPNAATFDMIQQFADFGLRAWAVIERLEQWKREAVFVLSEWERVFDAAGKPGKLGESKALATLAVIEAQERTIADLTDEIDRLIDRQSEAHG